MNNLEDLYQEYWKHHSKNISNGYTVLEIAAVSLSCALSIYKTALNEEDYYKMIEFICDNKDNVKKILEDNTIH